MQVKTIKVHRQGGKIRNPGDCYSTEDKLLLNSGFVALVGEQDTSYRTATIDAEAPGASNEASEEVSEEKPARRKYKRKDMTAE